MVAEYLALPVPLFRAGAPEAFARIAREPGDFSVAELPGIDQVPGRIMYDQTIHGKRIFIGTAARVPVEKMSYFFGLPLVRPLVEMRKGRLGLEVVAVGSSVARLDGHRLDDPLVGAGELSWALPAGLPDAVERLELTWAAAPPPAPGPRLAALRFEPAS